MKEKEDIQSLQKQFENELEKITTRQSLEALAQQALQIAKKARKQDLK